jgi:PAS domain S-box-containing protein
MLAPMPGRQRAAPRACALLFVAGLFVAPNTHAIGAEPAPELGIAQLGLERWTPADGLAGSWVRAIASTPDGFLWLGTSGGLSRFDGRNFVNFTAANDPALPGNMISALAVRAAGGLWVGLGAGGVRILEQGRLRTAQALTSVESLVPEDLLESPAGTLWIATESGLWRWRDGHGTELAPAALPRGAGVRRVVADPRSGLWVRTHDEGLWRVEGDRIEVVADAPGCAGIDLAVRPDGRLVTLCINGAWERQDGGVWTAIDTRPYPNRVYFDRLGDLWIAATDGLRRRAGSTWERLSSAQGTGDYRARAFWEDAAGDLWIGTFSQGVSRLRRGAVVPIGAPEGLVIDGTTGVVATAEGEIWIGSASDGVFRWHPRLGVVEHWGRDDGLPTDWVYAVAVDPRDSGRVWFGTEKGLFERTGGRLSLVARPDGRTDRDARLLYADAARPHTLWVGAGRGGLDELGPAGTRRHDVRNGLGLDRVRALGRLRDGRLLAGGAEGLFVLDGDRWRELTPPDGELRAVRAFREADDGTLWFSSSTSGLVRWRGDRVDRYGERQGLPSSVFHSVQLDASGSVWMSSDEGLTRVRSSDFDRWAQGTLDAVPLEQLRSREGLRDRECNGWGYPTSWELPDGRLLYPTSHGIALVDPARLPDRELTADRLFVERAWTGERALSPDALWHLGQRERHLRVRFGAIDHLSPESIQFRHRLEGLDPEWGFAGTQREVNYAALPPGRYRFRLQARRPGREWVEATSVARVEVEPALWESKALRLTLLLTVVSAVFAAYAWRARVERRHARALERERALLRDVIDISPNPIFAKGRDRTYTLANRAAAALYGLVPADLIGRRDETLETRVVGLDPIHALDREVLERGAERTLPEARVVDARAVERWFRVVERPRRTPSGEVEQVIGTAVDVTDFKLAEMRLRESESELQASQEALRRLTRRLIDAHEDERSRLARELHDDLTQRLAGAAMLLGGLSRAVEQRRTQGLPSGLEQLRSELEALAADTQALARELHPSMLDRLGLEEALRTECASFAQRSGLTIDFVCRELPGAVPREIGIGLFRIAQEALRNVHAHSGAKQASVSLRSIDGDLRLEVVDNGAGFDPNASRTGRGLGLVSMSERARLLGARLRIESGRDRGTHVVVVVPRDAAAEAATRK